MPVANFWIHAARINSFWLDFNGVLNQLSDVWGDSLFIICSLFSGPQAKQGCWFRSWPFYSLRLARVIWKPPRHSTHSTGVSFSPKPAGVVTPSLSADPRCSEAAVKLSAAVALIMDIDRSRHLFLEVWFRLWRGCADCPVNWWSANWFSQGSAWFAGACTFASDGLGRVRLSRQSWKGKVML